MRRQVADFPHSRHRGRERRHNLETGSQFCRCSPAMGLQHRNPKNGTRKKPCHGEALASFVEEMLGGRATGDKMTIQNCIIL